MENVLLKAEQLAEAILESEEYIRVRLNEQAVTHDAEATRLIADYSEKRAEVENVLAQNQMDHQQLADAGKALEAAEKAMDEYPLLRDMRANREKFNDMMKKVNQLIKLVVTGEQDEGEGCTGSCESCGGGCHHHH